MKRKTNREMLRELLVMLAFGTFFDSWCLMLAVQLAHRVWIPQLPTLGYWWSVLLIVLLRGTFSRYPKISRYKEPA